MPKLMSFKDNSLSPSIHTLKKKWFFLHQILHCLRKFLLWHKFQFSLVVFIFNTLNLPPQGNLLPIRPSASPQTLLDTTRSPLWSLQPHTAKIVVRFPQGNWSKNALVVTEVGYCEFGSCMRILASTWDIVFITLGRREIWLSVEAWKPTKWMKWVLSLHQSSLIISGISPSCVWL